MKYVIINEGTISIKRIMCNILIVYFTRKQWGNTDNLYPWHYMVILGPVTNASPGERSP